MNPTIASSGRGKERRSRRTFALTMKMKKKRLILVIAAILTLIAVPAIIILSQSYLQPVPFQFLHGKKPLVNEQGDSLSVCVFSFPCAFEDVCSKASTELTSLGFTDMTDPIVRNERHTFTKQDSNYSTIVTIHHSQFSKDSTNMHHIYGPFPGWVSVDVSRYGRSNLRRFLNRFLSAKPNPKISRRMKY